MKTLLPTEARNRWKKLLREVSEDLEDVRIHLKGGKGVVMMSQDNYESLIATLEVMSDPEAVEAIRKHRAGKAGKTYTREDIERAIRDSRG
jgi:antitoxin YefM